MASKEHMIAIEADPDDAEDFPVSEAALERALIGRDIRRLRQRLTLSQSEFARRYGIPLGNIQQYEIGRTMPPAAVRSYLKAISGDPEGVAAAIVA